MKTGLLLANLGTPDDTSVPAVRRYLAEFLMDPYVVDIPKWFRFALVYGAILPKRPAKSAEAYRKIWTERGSPLLFHSEDLTRRVQALLPGVPVTLGMRYGKPSLRSALDSLRAQGAERVKAFPLYPQYSLAATESSVQKIRAEMRAMNWDVPCEFVPAFYEHPAFLKSFAEVARPMMEGARPDYVLFSFHGIPERHVHKTDPTQAHCLAQSSCCDRISSANANCYRAQSYATARGIARELGLRPDEYGVSFQSRLGRAPWIKPFTDLLYPELPKHGVKQLLVLCPSFVADCLETLEEIEMRGRADFRAAGGTELRMVPSLNATETWARAVVEISAL